MSVIVGILLVVVSFTSIGADRAGFFIDNENAETTLFYKSQENLIILSVVVNDSVSLNLLLDTGCRNLILFGNRHTDLFRYVPGREVLFSGMGDGPTCKGKLSIGNKVTIGGIVGEQIPIVVVPSRSVFKQFYGVDGIIGYELFLRFEIEINPKERVIHFRPAFSPGSTRGYDVVPMRIVDSKPTVRAKLRTKEGVLERDLLIDTGSVLGLLIKSTDKKLTQHHDTAVLAAGLNGLISGYTMRAETVNLNNLELSNVATGVIYSPWNDQASIGMEILKDYSIIFNYALSYTALKRV